MLKALQFFTGVALGATDMKGQYDDPSPHTTRFFWPKNTYNVVHSILRFEIWPHQF